MTDSPYKASDLLMNNNDDLMFDDKKGKARNVFINKLKSFLQQEKGSYISDMLTLGLPSIEEHKFN